MVRELVQYLKFLQLLPLEFSDRVELFGGFLLGTESFVLLLICFWNSCSMETYVGGHEDLMTIEYYYSYSIDHFSNIKSFYFSF